MAQVGLLHGITTDGNADFRTSLPINLVPVPKDTGISKGYLKAAEGLETFCATDLAGVDRGGTYWRDVHYRVIGDKLVRINANGTCDALGSLPNNGRRVTFDYSFDRLGIATAGQLYYYSPDGLVQVTDTDLGFVSDVIWLDGYFITTDGASIVQTELNDPMAVNPLKYGSSEISPDPVNSLLKIRNELVAVNRYTIEYFENVGGAGFVFQRNPGAVIFKGSIGTHATCYYLDTFAFVGSGQNEALSVYLGSAGQALPISTREIDQWLQAYTQEELAAIVLESRVDKAHRLLYLHLPDKTLVYDAGASAVLGEPVWFTLASGTHADEAYRAIGWTFCYGKWLCGDKRDGRIGAMTPSVPTQYGDKVAWQFDTELLYNEGQGAIFHALELTQLPGRAAAHDAVIWHSYTEDGLVWSDPKRSAEFKPGSNSTRATWFGLGLMKQWRGLRFRGVNDAPAGIARLDVRVEGLR